MLDIRLDQAKSVIDIRAQLTPLQKVSAEYWADGPRSELHPAIGLFLPPFLLSRISRESRLYGGIHFYEGNVAGRNPGQKVGAQAFSKAKNYWLGSP